MYGASFVHWPSLVPPRKNSTLATLPFGSWASATIVKFAGAMKISPLAGSTMVTVGGVVSPTLTVWLHWALLPQASVATQVRVAAKEPPQAAFVTVLRMDIVTALQESVAVGASKLQALPCWAFLLAAQVIVGGVMSTTVTVWLH